MHLVSSANRRTDEEVADKDRSLILIRNNKGPRMLPCEIPDLIGNMYEICLLIRGDYT